jgi:hypothetical protein
MIPFLNDIDRLLQAAPSRFGEAYDRRLALSASARAFEVALDATVSPAAIVFIASRVGFSGGTVEFSTDTGTTLTVDGDVATLVGVDLKASGCEITATVTYQGEQYEAKQSIVKVLGFDSSTPPAPANLHTAGTLASIELSWDPTNNPNIGAVEIWRALTNDLSAAVAVGSTSGLARTYVDGIGAGGSFFYWIRYISKANVVGPFNAVAGTLGTAGTDAEYLLALLQGEITQSQLHDDLGAKIDLITADGETGGSVTQRIEQGDKANAKLIDQVQAIVSDPVTGLVAKYAAVKLTAEAAVSDLGKVQAKYAVNVDVDGVAGGFGIIGTEDGLTSTIDFGVRASTFFVAAPAGEGIPSQVPFVVRTTSTEVGGRSYPPGVYMDSAFIYDLHAERLRASTITAREIATDAITSDKIKAGAVSTDELAANAITSAKLSTDELLTESAQIADGLIVNAKIGTAAVDTLKIGANAVTVPSYVTGTGGDLINSGGARTWIGSVTLTFADTARLAIIANWQSAVPGGGTNTGIVVKNGSTDLLWSSDSAMNNLTTSHSASASTSLAAGTYTLDVYVFNDWSSGSFTLRNWGVLFIGAMR